jgi:hypothetical protein
VSGEAASTAPPSAADARPQLSRLDALRASLPGVRGAPVEGFCAAVRDVVLIASSSRGGSSMFAEMLRGCPGLLHFRGEINAFLFQAGLTWPDTDTGSDRLEARHAAGAAAALDRALALDAGRPGALVDPSRPGGVRPGPGPARPAEALEGFALDVAWRLAAQWPGLAPDTARLQREVADAWGKGDLQDFYLRLLASVRADHPRVNPWYYDLDPARIAAAFPGLAPPSGPPSDAVVEEPPFITIQPWVTATADDLARAPLVIKTPSNAYRLDFWRALFPGARFRVLHLVRNAAASVNGLYDGWRFRGFHAHPVEGLEIAGYSDVVTGGRRWWKYDLAPGWEALKGAPLEAVCAHQWRSAHRSTLDFLARTGAEHHRLRFEDVVGPPERRRAAFAGLSAWLGLGEEALGWLLARQVPPVMATAKPRARRWYEKSTLIGPVVMEHEGTRDLMVELGYSADPATWL